MKNIFKYIAGILLAGFTLAACSPEDFTGANGDIPQASDYEDNVTVTVDQETNYVYFEFTSAPGITPVWIIDGAYSSSYSLSKFYRKKGTYTIECKVRNSNGMSDGSIVKEFEIENTIMTGFPGFVEDSDFNMLKGVTLPDPWFYYAPGWSQISDPTWSLVNGTYTVTLPTATTERWQAQMAFQTTGVSVSADKKYDFSVIMTSTTEHGGVKVKLCDSSDNIILMDKDFTLEANEPKALWASGLDGVDISDLKIVFDFGGNAENTVINIESFVLKDHANDDGTEVPEETATPFDYNDSNNIWKAIDEEQAFTEEFWFGDANWGAIECTPEVTHDGSTHTITIPVETPAEEWHAQWKLHTDLSATADNLVDFSLKVSAKQNGDAIKLPDMTVKLTDSSNDDNYFFAERQEIPTDGYVFRFEDTKLAKETDASKLSLVFDFGGAPEGAVVTINEITLIKK